MIKFNFDNFDFFFLPGDVFLAPLFDSGEYLKKLTRFTGSFAIVFFSKNGDSVFFTDGRYLAQAKAEVHDGFLIKNIQELPSWIENVGQKSIAFDSRLLTHSWNKLLGGVQRVPLDTEVIDQFYQQNIPCLLNQDRKLDIYIYEEKYSGKSVKDKIRAFLQKFDGEYFLVLDPENVSWLLNIRSNNVNFNKNVSCFALVNYEGSIDLFLRDETEVEIDNTNIHHVDDFESVLQERKVAFLSFGKECSTLYFVNLLKKLEIEVDYVDDPIYLMRAAKNDVEAQNAIDIHIHDGVAVTRFFLDLIKNFDNSNVRISERDAVAELHELRKRNPNFVSDSFETIAAFGSNGAVIHYNPQNSKQDVWIEKDNLFLLDSGGHYFGGTTDITRTFCFGEPTAEQKKHYTLVLKGNLRLQHAIFPAGLNGFDLDMLARYDLLQHGVNYSHSTGHGVSNFLHVHEQVPRISKLDKTVLQPGMILSNEPGYYKEGHYGIRLENLMIAHENDDKFLYFECLTQVPFALNLIDWEMLERCEREWLKKYNENVFKKLKPFLNFDEQKLFTENFLF